MALTREAALINLPTPEILYRLLAAVLCGAVIGINRDLHHKSAGFRTFAMVSLGSALVTLVMSEIGHDPNAVSRVIQGVLTGIGFLGAGVILHQATSTQVLGLTTAAAIWLTAGLGVACGLGLYGIVTAGLVIALVVLMVGRPIERFAEKCFKTDRADPEP